MLDISSRDGQWLFNWGVIQPNDGNAGIFGPSGLSWHAGLGHQYGSQYNAIFDHGIIRVVRAATQELITIFPIRGGANYFDMSNDGIVRFRRFDQTITVSLIPGRNPIPADGFAGYKLTSRYNVPSGQYLPTSASASVNQVQMLDISSPNGLWLFRWTARVPGFEVDGNPGIFGPNGLAWHAGNGLERGGAFNILYTGPYVAVLDGHSQRTIFLYEVLGGSNRFDIGNDGIVRFYNGQTPVVSIIPGANPPIIPLTGFGAPIAMAKDPAPGTIQFCAGNIPCQNYPSVAAKRDLKPPREQQNSSSETCYTDRGDSADDAHDSSSQPAWGRVKLLPASGKRALPHTNERFNLRGFAFKGSRATTGQLIVETVNNIPVLALDSLPEPYTLVLHDSTLIIKAASSDDFTASWPSTHFIAISTANSDDIGSFLLVRSFKSAVNGSTVIVDMDVEALHTPQKISRYITRTYLSSFHPVDIAPKVRSCMGERGVTEIGASTPDFKIGPSLGIPLVNVTCKDCHIKAYGAVRYELDIRWNWFWPYLHHWCTGSSFTYQGDFEFYVNNLHTSSGTSEGQWSKALFNYDISIMAIPIIPFLATLTLDFHADIVLSATARISGELNTGFSVDRTTTSASGGGDNYDNQCGVSGVFDGPKSYHPSVLKVTEAFAEIKLTPHVGLAIGLDILFGLLSFKGGISIGLPLFFRVEYLPPQANQSPLSCLLQMTAGIDFALELMLYAGSPMLEAIKDAVPIGIPEHRPLWHYEDITRIEIFAFRLCLFYQKEWDQLGFHRRATNMTIDG